MDDLIQFLRNSGTLIFDEDNDFATYRINPAPAQQLPGSQFSANLHDPELKISIKALHFPKGVHKLIFSYLLGEDVKNCRLVCREWRVRATPALDEKTILVFDGGDSPWAFFTPAITKNCMNYLRESKNRFSPWSSMRVRCGSTSQLEPLMSDGFSNTFRQAVQRIKYLHLQTCFLDWDTFCRFLAHFTALESFFDDQNVYFERVSFLTQVMTTITVPLSPTISSSAITQLDFVNKFQKYNAILRIKSLRIQDSGIGNHCSFLMQLLCKIMADGCLEELEIVAGGAEASGSGLGENSLNKLKGVQLWIATGELLLFAVESLKKLTICCTHEKSPVNSFDLFVIHCIETVNHASRPLPLEHLSMDFKFLWLSHPGIESDLIPFVHSLHHLKKFYLKTVIMKPSWVHRLEELKPFVPNCFFDIGVHVTDIEGESNLEPIIQLMRSNLYQIFMSSLHVSVITQDILELGQMISSDPDAEYTNVKKFLLTVMNVSFLDFSVDIIVKNYPNLTVLELIDGPLVCRKSESDETNRNVGMKEHGVSQYGNMSHALFDDVAMQIVLKHLQKLQVLSLQCNMNGLGDVGITGLSPETCTLLRRSGNTSVVNLEYDLVGHSLVHLKDLRKLCLMGLGKLLTDVSVDYAFLKLIKLNQLVLYGTLELSSNAKNRLCKRLGDKRCQIQIHVPY